jgi:hypothetical protein
MPLESSLSPSVSFLTRGLGLMLLLALAGCGGEEDSEPPLFVETDPDSTGVTFTNALAPSPALNIITSITTTAAAWPRVT